MQPHDALNGVFSGGGINGITIGGAAAAALDAGYEFGHVVGSSSGALVASLIAAGYRADELERIAGRVPWPSIFRKPLLARIPVIGRWLAIGVARAQYRNDPIQSTWTKLLAAKGVATFADLPPNTLRIVATDITHQRGVVLPDHLPEYGVDPDTFPVALAVRMSTAVPFLVQPIRLTGSNGTYLFVDGAITTNFPLLVASWSRVWPIVGFRLEDHEPSMPSTIVGPASAARAIVASGIRAAATLHAPERDGLLIVTVPALRPSTDFNVTPAEARDLFAAGRRIGAAWFGESELHSA